VHENLLCVIVAETQIFRAPAFGKICSFLGIIGYRKLRRPAKKINGHLLAKDGFNCHQ
jgi:hypothetical protein